MGNNSKHAVVEGKRKKKKKGRPSLLDIQKRSLRLQEQQNPNPNPTSTPSPDSHLRLSGRRATRRNPEPASSDEDSGDGSGGRRKEKKLKLVHRLSGDDADPGSNSKGGGNEKGTDSSHQEETLESGPTTALPDIKLLEFILDRLQKKDTYGVYSEPVDPEELPDYHDIIEHPMDFGTVRKKLDGGTYSNLEQFENDVFLISTNAMKYNAPDTIYFRQARTINELTKKSFENLRDGTLGTEQEPKPAVRRGRPPNKNKKPENINKNPNEKNSAPDFSFDTPKNNHNNNVSNNNSVGRDNFNNDGGGNSSNMINKSNNQWSLGYDLTKRTSLGGERSSSSEMFSWLNDQRVEKNEPSSGYGWRGSSAKFSSGKKPGVNGIVDETQRKTYKISQQILLNPPEEFSILNTFDRDRKQLVPVGIQVEHVYARSLARFAAKLGPIGWSMAEQKIKRILPAGTRFGPGWVIDGEPVPKSEPDKFDEKLSNENNVNAIDGDKNSKNDKNEEVQRTTSCVTSENNCSEANNNINNNINDNNKPSKGTLVNGFNTPVQNMGKIMVPHSQTFRKNSNINNNQRHGLNSAPDLNVGFQQLGSPNSNSNLNSSSKVESSSQQPDLALQL